DPPRPLATIDARGSLLSRGTIVQLHGRVQGPPGERFGLTVLLEQVRQGRQIDAVGMTEGVFTGTGQPWSLRVSAPAADSFAAGTALAWGIGSGTGFVARLSLGE